ncbi:MAG: hypothetical protein ACRDKA_03280 [Actinomycetota bacterium]
MGAVLVFFGVATFPALFRPISTGLDPSWVYAINELPYKDVVYGRDVVFSFGPLGYLLLPADFGSNLAQAAVLALVAQAAAVGVLLYHARRSETLLPLFAFVLVFFLAPSLGLFYEYRVLLLLGLLLTISPQDRRAWRAAALIAATMTAVLLLARPSTGVAALAMVTLSLAVWGIQHRVRLREVLLYLALPLGTVLLVLMPLLFGGPTNVIEWLQVAWEFTAGYSEAMSYPGPASITLLVTATIGIYGVAAFLMSRRDSLVTPVALALGALIILGFRHGIVRHYGRFVPAIVMVALATLVLSFRSRRGVSIGLAASVIVLTLNFGISLIPECLCPWSPASVNPLQGLRNVGSVIRLPSTKRQLATQTSAHLADDRLPPEMVSAIRSDGGAVDVVPWEIVFTEANALPWEPNPVLQTYSAYTASLDQRTAIHFTSPDAPEFLLVQFIEIDARHPMLGAPAFWRAMLERYAPSHLPIADGEFGRVALLRRREAPREVGLRPFGRTSGRIGRWIDLPSSPGLVFGSVRLRHDLSGRLAALAWRVEPMLIDLKLAEGGVITVRFLPSTAENGLLLNHLPMTLQELLDLYEGALPRELVAIRVHGEGASSFEPGFEVRWFEAEWEEQSSGGPGAR